MLTIAVSPTYQVVSPGRPPGQRFWRMNPVDPSIESTASFSAVYKEIEELDVATGLEDHSLHLSVDNFVWEPAPRVDNFASSHLLSLYQHMATTRAVDQEI